MVQLKSTRKNGTNLVFPSWSTLSFVNFSCSVFSVSALSTEAQLGVYPSFIINVREIFITMAGVGKKIFFLVWLMPLFRVRQKLKLELAETHMRRMRCAWGFEFCRPVPVPGKLGFFYVHTKSVHGAACLTSS